MCLFSRENTNINGRAYKLGVTQFDCGVCPECLSKKARLWSLRCSAEAQYNRGIMITLTYDDYLYANNRCIGEKPVNPNLKCSVDHIQKFIKRLRKHFDGHRIKYLVTAEHGKRTNRAHYHAILFGIDFPDRIAYKKSKRGNMIYKSATLTKIWGYGICTIDAVNISGKIARYCTKYCAKDSRCDDTFMLMSRGIGDKWLLEKFNGKSYILDGVEYPIPKLIWNKYIVDKYKNNYIFQKCGATYKYRSLDWFIEKYPLDIALMMSDWQKKRNRIFSNFKRSNKRFQMYLQYWSTKADLLNLNRPSELDRIRALPDDKYFAYKQKAIPARFQYEQIGRCVVPRSRKTSWRKFLFAPFPLVIKGQMTPKPKEKYFKTVWWSKNLQDFVYLRPSKC